MSVAAATPRISIGAEAAEGSNSAVIYILNCILAVLCFTGAGILLAKPGFFDVFLVVFICFFMPFALVCLGFKLLTPAALAAFFHSIPAVRKSAKEKVVSDVNAEVERKLKEAQKDA